MCSLGEKPAWTYRLNGSRIVLGDSIMLKAANRWILKLQIWKDTHGQDLIEYALMAGFVAIAAGAIMPAVSANISKIFSKISSTMTTAAAQS